MSKFNLKSLTLPDGTAISIEEGHTLDEWKEIYGDSESFWDFDPEEISDGTICGNPNIMYWEIDGRLYETDIASPIDNDMFPHLQSAFSLCNRYLDIEERQRQEFLEEIREIFNTIGNDKTINFNEVPEGLDGSFDEYSFSDACDLAYITGYDKHSDSEYYEQVTSANAVFADSENLRVQLYDMSATQLMQLYRCICEYLYWQKTGVIKSM